MALDYDAIVVGARCAGVLTAMNAFVSVTTGTMSLTEFFGPRPHRQIFSAGTPS